MLMLPESVRVGATVVVGDLHLYLVKEMI